MAFAVSDLEDFISLLRQHPEWRERVRHEILGDDMQRIEARFERIEKLQEESAATIRQILAAQAETNAKLDALTEKVTTHDARFDGIDGRLGGIDGRLDGIDGRLDGIDRRFDGVGRRFDGIDGRLDGLDERFDGVDRRLDRSDGRLGNLEGSAYERKFNAPARVGKPFRKRRSISVTDVDEIVDAHSRDILSDADLEQLAALDYLILARRGPGADAPEVYIAFEVSVTVDGGDVQRAANRAALIRKAGLEAEAYAGGRVVTASARALAAELGVTLVVDTVAAA